MAEIKSLIEGYKRFYNDNIASNEDNILKSVQTSQQPKTLIISCSDSRVDPAILTNAEIGDIFAVRNVANIVPPYQPMWESYHGTSAAIEYAVKYLKVEHIVVMGHSNCGGVKALLDHEMDSDSDFCFIKSWMKIIEQIKDTLLEDGRDKYTFCEQEGIKVSIRNLMTFPFVREKVEANELEIHGWYFSLNDGSLSTLNMEKNIFEQL